MNRKTLYITQSGVIAAIYVILTLLSNAAGLASGVIQVRISEALTILPIFTPAAVPGLFTGCLISNIITGCAPWDVVFGSLATLIGAVFTRMLKNHIYLASLPPVLANMAIIPWVLSLVYQFEGSIWYFALTVGAGEVISCIILGQLLRATLEKQRHIFNLDRQ